MECYARRIRTEPPLVDLRDVHFVVETQILEDPELQPAVRENSRPLWICLSAQGSSSLQGTVATSITRNKKGQR